MRQPCLIDRRLPLFEDSPLTNIVMITCLNLYDCIILNDTIYSIYITLSHFDHFVVHLLSINSDTWRSLGSSCRRYIWRFKFCDDAALQGKKHVPGGLSYGDWLVKIQVKLKSGRHSRSVILVSVSLG